LCREVVEATCLHRGQPFAQAGQRERVVAHGTDTVLCLPDSPTLDARAPMKRVDDAPSKQVTRLHRWWTHALTRRDLATQEPEAWPGGTKLRRRRHREVELQRVGEQEHPVGGRTSLEVDQGQRSELVAERTRPGIEHVRDWYLVDDSEGKVQVRETIAAAYG